MHLGSKGDLPADIFSAKTGSEENEDQVKIVLSSIRLLTGG
jgi:hypothetical protein